MYKRRVFYRVTKFHQQYKANESLLRKKNRTNNATIMRLFFVFLLIFNESLLDEECCTQWQRTQRRQRSNCFNLLAQHRGAECLGLPADRTWNRNPFRCNQAFTCSGKRDMITSQCIF